MKKIAFVVAVLLLATPALAVINITPVDEGSGVVRIDYDASGHGQLPRAFALNITVTAGAITAISDYFVGEGKGGSGGFGIFPGRIDINDITGEVDSNGTPEAVVADLPGDTLGGLNTTGVTIEMGSLYVGGPNAPGGSGTLCKVTVTETCTLTVSGNIGRGKVVNEDKTEAATNLPQGISVVVGVADITISGTITGTGQNTGVTVGGLPGPPVTNGSGFYTCTATPPYTGTATPTYASSNYSPASIPYSAVSVDQLNQDYTSSLKTFTVSGTVTYAGSGLSGVTMSGLPGAPVTIGDGTYSDTVTYGWNGTITPSLATYAFTPANRSPGPVTGTVTGQDFSAYPACWDWVSHCKGNATDVSGGTGYVNLDDFTAFRIAYMKTYKNDWNAGAGPYNPCADFDNSGKVNLDDFTIFRINYRSTGSGCTPAAWPPPLID